MNNVHDYPGYPVWARAVGDSASISTTGSFEFNSSYNVAFFNKFAFAAARSVRSSTMILAAFNIMAAFTTVVAILLDSWVRTRRRNPHFSFARHGFSFVSLPEMFPLVLSIGIMVQSSIFVSAQSLGLQGVSVLGCTFTSQIMFPAVFIVPYLQMVFSLNQAWIASKASPFSKRGRWNVTICLAVVFFMLVVKYIVALFVRPPNFCFASLYWFILRWGLACFILELLVIVSLIASAAIVFIKLRTTAPTDPEEKSTASTMVYYMVIGILTNFLLIPFFFSIGVQKNRFFNSSALQLSLVSSIVANISGILTGGLHLYLRSKIIADIPATYIPEIQSNKTQRHEDFKRHIRVHTNTDEPQFKYDYQSVSKPPPTAGLKGHNKMDSQSTLYDPNEDYMPEKAEWARKAPSESIGADAMFVVSDLPQEPPKIFSPEIPPPRKGYPTADASNMADDTVALLPSTTYMPDMKKMPVQAESRDMSLAGNSAVGARGTFIATATQMPMVAFTAANSTTIGANSFLAPPPYGKPPGKPSHKRNSSLGSMGSLGSLGTSATVQIGLRLSNADDVRLNSGYFQDKDKVYSINYDVPPSMANPLSPLPKKPSPLSNAQAAPQSEPESPASERDNYSSRYYSNVSGVTGFSGFNSIDSFTSDLPIQLQVQSPTVEVPPLNLATLNSMVYDPNGPGNAAARKDNEDGVSPISPDEESSHIEIGLLASPRTASAAQKSWA